MHNFVTFNTDSGVITGKYVVASSADAANYSNTLTINAGSLAVVEFANKVSSGGVSLLSKLVTSISVVSSIFLADGVTVCSMQISPVSNSILVSISGFSSAFAVTSADPYISLTSNTARPFTVDVQADIDYYAQPVTIVSTYSST